MANLMYTLLIAAAAFGAIFGAFKLKESKDQLPPKLDTLPAFATYIVRKKIISLAIMLAGCLFFGFVVGFILFCFVMPPVFVIKLKDPDAPELQILKEKELPVVAAAANQEWLRSLGTNVALRAQAIDDMFAERTKTLTAVHFESWSTRSGDEDMKFYLKFGVSRSLATMSDRECTALCVAEQLNSVVNGSNDTYRRWCAVLLWGDGKGQSYGSYQYLNLDGGEPMRDFMAKRGYTVDSIINAIASEVHALAANPATDPALRLVATASVERIKGGPMASSGMEFFLKAADAPNTVFRTRTPYAIHLGRLPDGTPLTYSGPGALVTIAPPGSGKSQCHVIPTLLRWNAPALILDVKDGELYAATSKWRAANVGPVYRFSPTDPARSHHYNPLAFISEHSDNIWQESRFLTDMLIVPAGTKDSQFWDSKAKELVAAAVAYICYTFPPAERNMSKLLDIINGGAPLQQMLVGLSTAVDVPQMVRAGTSLAEMSETMKGSVLATVQTSFHGWGDAPVTRVTDRCDWSPLDLRTGVAGGHPTIYVCLSPSEVKSYKSILRVFIAQHIRMLIKKAPAEADRDKILPILLVLDELPQLGDMPPVSEAIEMGASYGLRVWMFAQFIKQLQDAYPTADGMMGACAVRAYMNPSGEDGMAEKLSEQLGYVATMADGTRKRMVEAADLAGPPWERDVLVLAGNTKPARLRKNYAYADPELKLRMGSL
jgi:type IV secretion system protein VirD4